MAFNYYKGSETPFDFSPIVRGGESVGAGFQQVGKAFAEAAAQQKMLAQRKAEMQQEAQTAAQNRLLTASEGVLNRDAAKAGDFENFNRSLALQQDRDRSLTASQAAQSAAGIEEAKIRANAAIEAQRMQDAQREKEKQDALKTQAYGSQFYRALSAAHADDSTEPVVKSTKTRSEWLFPGLSDSEVDVVLKGMYHDPEQAKAAAQYLKGKETIRVFDENKAQALLDQAQSAIVKPGDENHGQIGRQMAIDEFRKANAYAGDHEEGIKRAGEAFLRMFPANVRMQPVEEKPLQRTIGGMNFKFDSATPTPEQLIGAVGTAVSKQMETWDKSHAGNTPDTIAARNAVAEDKIRNAAMEAGLDPDQALQMLTKKPEAPVPVVTPEGKPMSAVDRLNALKAKYQK